MDRTQESLKAFVGVRRTADKLAQLVKEDVKRYNLNINEFGVLELLYHKGDTSIQHIKNKILIASSSTTYIIDKLCEKGLVERYRDDEDRRIIYASLTDPGRALIEEIFPCHAETIRKAFDQLSDEELADFRRILKIVSASSQFK
ncbi:MarR family winged helix-turn-helix transcriptional regulator [Hutsoniella sourekii]|uniref:MarR family winged helix-turn-helix transcriptional regulator n=1 Tax=Hutsoniella sourekii TaxID=87650 RepID=UPI000488905E|nr:MarR family transcriptional regulator [Hutsoniella sourekii]